METNKVIKIGTRGSDLALWQANHVLGLIAEYFPSVKAELMIINTKGDLILDKELHKIGDKGLFTKELEKELLEGNIDAAVHSLKDMQTEMPPGLKLAAVTKRHNPADVLISKNKGLTVQNLRIGAVVATGSLRRKAQLLALRPDLQINDLRGNINTRLNKYENSNWDCIILAAAGVERLGYQSYISQYIPEDIIIPAVGQGALGIQIRDGDTYAEAVFGAIGDIDTTICTSAERAFLKAMGGGCRTPMAAHAVISDGTLLIKGMAAAEDGSKVFKNSVSADIRYPETAGIQLADLLIASGAGSIKNDNIA